VRLWKVKNQEKIASSEAHIDSVAPLLLAMVVIF
jgi:hypothetical protein